MDRRTRCCSARLFVAARFTRDCATHSRSRGIPGFRGCTIFKNKNIYKRVSALAFKLYDIVIDLKLN